MAEGIKDEIVSKLLDSVPTLLILLGAAFLVLGLAGGVTYKDWLRFPDSQARIGAVLAGAAFLGLGFFSWRTRVILPKAKTYGIKIDHPRSGDHVDVVDVRGSIKKTLPEGYTLKVFRIFPGTDGFIPIGQARIEIETGTWEAVGCTIGGKAGDKRSIGVYLVGPGGTVVLDYFTKASGIHNTMRDQLKAATGKEGEYLPAIEKRTPDMIECHRVSVWRS